MAQGPISSTVAQAPGGSAVPLQSTAGGSLATTVATTRTSNITATGQLKTGPGVCCTIVNKAGVAGFTLSDIISGGSAAAANEIFSIGTTTVGQIIVLNLPFSAGLALTTLGASGNLTIAFA